MEGAASGATITIAEMRGGCRTLRCRHRHRAGHQIAGPGRSGIGRQWAAMFVVVAPSAPSSRCCSPRTPPWTWLGGRCATSRCRKCLRREDAGSPPTRSSPRSDLPPQRWSATVLPGRFFRQRGLLCHRLGHRCALTNRPGRSDWRSGAALLPPSALPQPRPPAATVSTGMPARSPTMWRWLSSGGGAGGRPGVRLRPAPTTGGAQSK